MKTLRTALVLTLALAMPAAAIAGGCGGSQAMQARVGQPDIVDTAVEAGSFNTLAAALTAAGLVDALKGEGPFTVFAPTDEAFAKLPAGTVEELLKPENKDRLTAILTYHVVAGAVKAEQVVTLDSAETLNGQRVAIAVSDGGVKVDGANVVTTDIEASNGVIHVIDSVLLPAEQKDARADATRLIEMAIDRGAPMYNHGNAAGCAAIYEMTARALLELDADLPREARTALSGALAKMERTHSADRQAWVMRHGLDEAYRAMRMELARR